MRVGWADKALDDIERLCDFVAGKNPQAASHIRRRLKQNARDLGSEPRIGRQVLELLPREVRYIVAGDYVMRYEIFKDELYIVRIWHGREDWPYLG